MRTTLEDSSHKIEGGSKEDRRFYYSHHNYMKLFSDGIGVEHEIDEPRAFLTNEQQQLEEHYLT